MSVYSLFSYAHAQSTPNARALFEEAEIHYRLQEFEAALNKYKEAYTLSKLPGHLVNIGQCYRQLGRYREALLSFQSFLDEVPGSSLRPQLERIMEELKPLALNEPDNTPPQNKPITPELASHSSNPTIEPQETPSEDAHPKDE